MSVQEATRKLIGDGLDTPREQIVYANILILGVWVGIFILFVTFALYVFGAATPQIPIEETPRYWGRGVEEYIEATHWPHGWAWTGMLDKGDLLTYVGLVPLALLSILGYVVLFIAYIRERSGLFAVICALEILVLGIAASGVLVAGGH